MPTRMLLADNDLAHLLVMKEFFEAEGFIVDTAANPAAARSSLARSQFEVAVLDLRLEDNRDARDLSGLRVAQTNPSCTPVIILTDFPNVEAVCGALSTNDCGKPVAFDFISKPEGLETLLAAVRKVIGGLMESQDTLPA